MSLLKLVGMSLVAGLIGTVSILALKGDLFSIFQDRKVYERHIMDEDLIFYYGRETTPFTGIGYNCNGEWQTYEEGIYIKLQRIVKTESTYGGKNRKKGTVMCRNFKKNEYWVTCVEAGEKEFDKKEWDSLPFC